MTLACCQESSNNTAVEINWNSLTVLVQQPFSAAQSSITNITAIEESLAIPLEYYPFVEALPLPFDDWLNEATNLNTSTWNVTVLELWANHYVEYHNGVIKFLNEMASNQSTSLNISSN